MTWMAVARKDFEDAIRSRTLWVLSALYVVFVGGSALVYGLAARNGAGTVPFLRFVVGPTGAFVSITALLLGYRSIAGERESGRIKLLLGLPHSREEVLVGKTVGRTVVLVVPLLGGFLVALAIVGGLFETVDVGTFSVFVLATVAFALTYVAIGVGISATTGSTTLAAVGAVGFWLVFQLLWSVVPLLLYLVATGFRPPPGPPPSWTSYVDVVSPGSAYTSLVGDLLAGGSPVQAASAVPTWAPSLVFVAWLVASLSVGYVAFSRADL